MFHFAHFVGDVKQQLHFRHHVLVHGMQLLGEVLIAGIAVHGHFALGNDAAMVEDVGDDLGVAGREARLHMKAMASGLYITVQSEVWHESV